MQAQQLRLRVTHVEFLQACKPTVNQRSRSTGAMPCISAAQFCMALGPQLKGDFKMHLNLSDHLRYPHAAQLDDRRTYYCTDL
jgi:hypothetical protein